MKVVDQNVGVAISIKCNGVEESKAERLDGNTVSEIEETISLINLGTTISLSEIERSKCLDISYVSK